MNTVIVHTLDCDTDKNDSVPSDDEVPLSTQNIIQCENSMYDELHLSCLAKNVALYVLGAENMSDKELHIVLLSQAEMKAYNMQFRKQDAVTDVLSFSTTISDAQSSNESTVDMVMPAVHILAEADAGYLDELCSHIGDVLICTEYIEKQARENSEVFETEFARIIIHGVLHILGYTHASYDMNHEPMLKRQELILTSFLSEAEVSKCSIRI